MTAPLPDLVLYGRADCSLCDELRTEIEALLAARSGARLPVPLLVERDIDSDPAWHDAYFASIPVVELAGRRLEVVTNVGKVRRLLAEVLDASTAIPAGPTLGR